MAEPRFCLDCGRLVSRAALRCHRCAGKRSEFAVRAAERRRTVRLMVDGGMRPVDVAAALGVSRQRVNQLLAPSRRR